YDLPHHQYQKRAQKELAKADRTVSRRSKPKGQPQSHGYRLAKFKAARLKKKIANQRKHAARKWAKKVAEDHDLIAVEDFQPKFLAKTTMAKKSADAAIGAAKMALIWQATKRGRTLELVHPAHTTMDCAQCGARAKHRLPLGQRTYTCQSCGAFRSRDKNSAAVMVARAGFVPADAEGVRPGVAVVLPLAS
ncbi:MAG TPA: transposase, partial [Beutenbergiaceae bacterium]|nr:transposase [Beutenbergiaceae bacterium]